MTGRLSILLVGFAAPIAGHWTVRPVRGGEQIELGRRLFADRGLSADGLVSCGTCHDPSRAFADGRPTAIGVYGRRGTRNAPSLLNVRSSSTLAWDGRRLTVEAQIRDAFFNPNELGLAGQDDLQRRLPRGVSPEDAVGALASYVRSLDDHSSCFDRFRAGDRGALDPAQRRGFALFEGRAHCVECHSIREPGADFTDHQFHAIDFEDPALTAPSVVTAKPAIGGQFKTGQWEPRRVEATPGGRWTSSLRSWCASCGVRI